MLKVVLVILPFILCKLVLCSKSIYDSAVTVPLPDVSYSKLVSLDKSAAIFAANSLVTTGALQISNIPNFDVLRFKALSSLGDCLASDSDAVTRVMDDGSKRATIDAITIDGIAGEMSSSCGDEAVGLRAVVDAASRQLFVALDLAVQLADDSDVQPIMTPYNTFTDLLDHGSHLEHLHTYYSTGSSPYSADAKPTLDVHMDSGLFIAMTTGLWSDDSSINSAHGVYIETPTGVLARMESSDNALIIMVGDGGARWLAPKLGASLRAVPHALLADVIHAQSTNKIRTRSWYGKMFLPPKDAIIHDLSMTFAAFREHQLEVILGNLDSATEGGVDISASFPLGCGHFGLNSMASSHEHSSYRGLLATTMKTCMADELKCWMTCYSTKNLSCGMEAACIDIVTNQEIPGDEMCPDGDGNCKLMCLTYNSTDYCYGSGVTMEMTGFVTAPQHGNAPCFNLWFEGWTLDSKAKFVVASFGVFFLGISIQLLTQFRTNFSKSRNGGVFHKPLSVILYGIQTTVSYFVMLIAMTYSAELFAMTCLGLTIGYGLINIDLTGLIPVSAQFFTSNTNHGTQSNRTGSLGMNIGNDDEDGKCCDGNEEGITAKLI